MIWGPLLLAASGRNLFLPPAVQPGVQQPAVQPAAQPAPIVQPEAASSRSGPLPFAWPPRNPFARAAYPPRSTAPVARVPQEEEGEEEEDGFWSIGFLALAGGFWAAFALSGTAATAHPAARAPTAEEEAADAARDAGAPRAVSMDFEFAEKLTRRRALAPGAATSAAAGEARSARRKPAFDATASEKLLKFQIFRMH